MNAKEEKAKNSGNEGRLGWLSTLIEKAHHQSFRDVQFAIQSTVSITIGFMIGFKTDYKDSAVISWGVTAMAGALITDTLGGTLMLAKMCAVNFSVSTTLIYVLQKIGMGYHDYASSAVTFFFICFVAGYLNPQTFVRKMGLAMPVIFYSTLITTPRNLIGKYFAWQLLGEFLMAICIAIAVSMFILPRYASTEIHDRVSYTLGKVSKVFELAMLAYMSTRKTEAEVYLMEADQILANLVENQDTMNVRLFLSQYEPSFLFRKITRFYQPLYLEFTLPELVSTSSTLIWHCQCIINGIRNCNFNKHHVDRIHTNRASFLVLIQEMKEVMRLIQANENSGFLKFAVSNDSLDRALQRLLHSYDSAYHLLSIISKDAYDNDKEISIHHQSEKLTNLKNRKEFEKHTTEEKKERIPLYDLDARKEGNGLTLCYLLFHLTEFIESLNNRFHSQSRRMMKEQKEKAAKEAQAKIKNYFYEIVLLPIYAYFQTMIFTHLSDYQNKIKTGLRTAILLGIGLIFVELPILANRFEQGQWIMFAMIFATGDSFGGSLTQMRLRLFATLIGAIYGYFIYIAVTHNNPNETFDLTNIETVYKVMGLMAPFSLVCGVIRQNKQWSYFGFLANITALLVTLGRVPYQFPVAGDYSLLRIQENALGICLSFVVSLITIPVFGLDLLKGHMRDVMFLLLRSITKLSNIYEKDIVSHEAIKQEQTSLTKAHLIPLHNEYKELLQEIGVREPSSTIKTDLDLQEPMDENALQTMSAQDPIIQTTGFTFFDQDLTAKELEELKNSSKKLQKINYLFAENMGINYKISQQVLYIPQASMESIFGSKPFPELLYQKVVTLQMKVLQYLLSLDRILLRLQMFLSIKSLQGILKVFINEFSDHLKQLFDKMKESLQIMIKQIQNSFILPDDTLWKVIKSIKDKFSCCCSTITATVSNDNSNNNNNGNNDNNYHHPDTKEEEKEESFESIRQSHILLMKELHYYSVKMFLLSTKFHFLLIHDWLKEVLIKSNLITTQESDRHSDQVTVTRDSDEEKKANAWLQREVEVLQNNNIGSNKYQAIEMVETVPHDIEAGHLSPSDSSMTLTSGEIIHRLSTVLATFNSLFYTTSQLGKTVEELSNAIYTITNIENRVDSNLF